MKIEITKSIKLSDFGGLKKIGDSLELSDHLAEILVRKGFAKNLTMEVPKELNTPIRTIETKLEDSEEGKTKRVRRTKDQIEADKKIKS